MNHLQIRSMLTIKEIEKTFKDLNIPLDNNVRVYDSLSFYPQYIDNKPLELDRRELVTTITPQKRTEKQNTNYW